MKKSYLHIYQEPILLRKYQIYRTFCFYWFSKTLRSEEGSLLSFNEYYRNFMIYYTYDENIVKHDFDELEYSFQVFCFEAIMYAKQKFYKENQNNEKSKLDFFSEIVSVPSDGWCLKNFCQSSSDNEKFEDVSIPIQKFQGQALNLCQYMYFMEFAREDVLSFHDRYDSDLENYLFYFAQISFSNFQNVSLLFTKHEQKILTVYHQIQSFHSFNDWDMNCLQYKCSSDNKDELVNALRLQCNLNEEQLIKLKELFFEYHELINF